MGKIGSTFLIAAVLFATPVVDAHVTTAGAAFHNYNAKEDVDIDYVSQGVRNLSTSSRFVVAPVTYARTEAGGNSTFTITGRAGGPTPTSFTLWVHRFGVINAAVSFNGAGAGFYTVDQTVGGLDGFSTISVLASLPPTSDAVIYSVVQRQ